MIKPKLPLDKQMSFEACKLSAHEIAESGDLGDLVGQYRFLVIIFVLFGAVYDRLWPLFRFWQN